MSARALEYVILACAAVAVLAMGQESRPREDVERTIQESAMKDEMIKMDVIRLTSARDRIGSHLMAIVGDSNRPVAERHEAARLLGNLQYMPAIAVLIDHVDLVDPTQLRSEIRLDLRYPLATALAAYGNAAMPEIVDAFLGERNPQKQWALAYAIRFGNMNDVALRYLRGTEPPDEKDWLKRQNMEALEQRLKMARR